MGSVMSEETLKLRSLTQILTSADTLKAHQSVLPTVVVPNDYMLVFVREILEVYGFPITVNGSPPLIDIDYEETVVDIENGELDLRGTMLSDMLAFGTGLSLIPGLVRAVNWGYHDLLYPQLFSKGLEQLKKELGAWRDSPYDLQNTGKAIVLIGPGLS